MIPRLASDGKSFEGKSRKQVQWGEFCGILTNVKLSAANRGITTKLETGIRGKQSVAVTPENTAKTMGSGTLNVFATPALVALAEKTCWMSVADALDEGCGSVGTRLELEHTAPTPVGMTVTCESELTAVEGRKLVFKVSLYDEKGPVGGGVHERFVVNDAKFAAKAERKKG